jgi:low temperature requirement protein LtrA
MNRFQRPDAVGAEQRATALELFYDLVFVFAVTQVSYVLLSDLTCQVRGRRCLSCSSFGGRGRTRRG